MPPINTDPRSRIGLGSIAPRESTIFTQKHPHRLRRSQSLPNFWFPPHCGPIPPHFEVLARKPLLHPPTPPGPGQEATAANELAKSKEALDHHASLWFEYPSLDQSKHLNIETATGIGSTEDPVGFFNFKETCGDETDYHSTRFLLLSNISKTAHREYLRESIVESLTSANVDVPLSIDSIKGFFLRCQETHGIAMLVFFDVRHAEIAKEILSLPKGVAEREKKT